MDLMVLEVQQWLNDTFPSYFRYDENGINSGSFPIEPDGKTGNRTMTALVMAVQIRFSLQPVDGIWGAATSAACPVIHQGVTDYILIKIVQGGFYCKGYQPGGFDGKFGPNLSNAINKFKTDLGIIDINSRMEQDVFKSLLTTDPTVLVFGGSEQIRTVQQFLNGQYYRLYKAKLGYISTGGYYDAKTSKALIYAFQEEIGTNADGALGPATFAKMPNIGIGTTGYYKLIIILRALLICHGYSVELNGGYTGEVAAKVVEFQKFMCLDLDSYVLLGNVNRRTWGALLWSKGDTDRKANACDCRQQLDAIKASSLYESGYRYVGRYLTKVPGGWDKNLTPTEINAIIDTGLKIFPIFQEAHDKLSDFSYSSGFSDGYKAIMAATNLLIPPGTTLYFAVDFDATEAQAKNQITKYFEGINRAIIDIGSKYAIGIYSARNTCSIINEAELAESSFVSNMSTGYSGNLGFLMPNDWAYDQYKTGSFTASDGSKFDIDSVMASPNAKAFNHVAPLGEDNWDKHLIGFKALSYISTNKAENVIDIVPYIRQLEDIYWANADNEKEPIDGALAVLHYLWKNKYGPDWQFDATLVTDNKFISLINNNYPALRDSIAKYTIDGSNFTFLKEYSVLEDVEANISYQYNRLFELAHLAVVISAYIRLDKLIVKFLTRPAWFGWAGDLATGFKEINGLKSAHPNSTPLEHARDRICEMEILNKIIEGDIGETGEVQLNYCDIIADMDGIGISVLIKKAYNNKEDMNHLVSNSFIEYYKDAYKQRNQFWLNNLKPDELSVDGISNALVEYAKNPLNLPLIVLKAGICNDEDIEACSRSLAEFIVHDIKRY